MTDNKVKQLLNLWAVYYRQHGVSDEFAQKCLDYAGPLFKKDVPVIFDVQHLCLLLELKREYLDSVVFGSENHYRSFYIRKKSGGLREITTPYYTLKVIQTWIYNNILSHVKVSGCAHGFRPKRSIVTNAKMHVKNTCLLKIDLKDFFPSIKKNKIVQIFKEIGYSKKVSFILASICSVDDHLPQGAPTSPVISNIVAHHMDNRLIGLCKKLGYNYTRYADDIAISGEQINSSFVPYVCNIICQCGFEVNINKIKLYNGNGAKILTGVSLANKRIRIPREYRRTLEQELYYIKQFGLAEHIRKKRINNPYYLESLIGRLGYWLLLEPDNIFAKQSIEQLRSLRNQRHI